MQPSNVGALFPQDGLSQAIAANRAPTQLKVGGIVSAKKANKVDPMAHQRITDHEKLCRIMQEGDQ